MTKAYRKNTKLDLTQHGMQIIDMPIPDRWHDLARQKGMTIVARIQDRYHLALICDACGSPSKHKIFALRMSQPQCPHCLETQWRTEAKQAGLEYLRRDPEDNMYAFYRAPCGHEVRRQPDRMRQIAAGKNDSRCETCHAAREAAEAEVHGWTLIGPDPKSDAGYRVYQHGCGHWQRIARANMQTERLACANCGECWSSAPSYLYLLRMTLPGHGVVVKLGYSRNPASRMRHQLGMSADLGCALITQIPMRTGHDAIRIEKRLHKKLRSTYPDAVIASDAIAQHLNVVSEIYDAGLEQIILAELARIATETKS